MISARISVFASATAAAARAIRACTNPGGGRAPGQRLDELRGPVHREVVGIRNAHQACTCTLWVTVPDALALGGAGAYGSTPDIYGDPGRATGPLIQPDRCQTSPQGAAEGDLLVATLGHELGRAPLSWRTGGEVSGR
jgi:hypothetical protein